MCLRETTLSRLNPERLWLVARNRYGFVAAVFIAHCGIRVQTSFYRCQCWLPTAAFGCGQAVRLDVLSLVIPSAGLCRDCVTDYTQCGGHPKTVVTVNTPSAAKSENQVLSLVIPSAGLWTDV